MLELKRLHLLRQLSLMGSLSRVAQAEGLTRPAVSRQISLLEQETGLVLFERSGRGVRLTVAGERLVAHTPGLFGAIRDIEADIAQMRQYPDRPLTISALGSAMIALFPAALQTLRQSYPDVVVRVEEHDSEASLQRLSSKQVDLAVFDANLDSSRFAAMLDIYSLGTDSMVVVCARGHPLAAQEAVTLEALGAERWALNQASRPYADQILARCAAVGVTPRISVSCRNLATTLELVRSENLVTVIPGLSARSSLLEHAFAVLRLEPALSREIQVACLRGGRRRPVVAAAIRALRRAART